MAAVYQQALKSLKSNILRKHLCRHIAIASWLASRVQVLNAL